MPSLVLACSLAFLTACDADKGANGSSHTAPPTTTDSSPTPTVGTSSPALLSPTQVGKYAACFLTPEQVTRAIDGIWEPQPVDPKTCNYESAMGTFFQIGRFKDADPVRVLGDAQGLCNKKPPIIDVARGFACIGGVNDTDVMGWFISERGRRPGEPGAWYFLIDARSDSSRPNAVHLVVKLLDMVAQVDPVR